MNTEAQIKIDYLVGALEAYVEHQHFSNDLPMTVELDNYYGRYTVTIRKDSNDK